MSIELSFDTNPQLDEIQGVHLTWVPLPAGTIIEQHLLTYNSTDRGAIQKTILPANYTTFTVPLSSILSGKSYLYTICQTDNTGKLFTSNSLTKESPYETAVPILTAVVGGADNQSNPLITCTIELAPLGAGESPLSGNPSINFIVVPQGATGEYFGNFFTISRPLKINGVVQTEFVLSNQDNAALINYQFYEVCAYILPDPTDTDHTVQSNVSESFLVQPTDRPLAAVLSQNASHDINGFLKGINISWAKPVNEAFYLATSAKYIAQSWYRLASKTTADYTQGSSVDLKTNGNIRTLNVEPPVVGIYQIYVTIELDSGISPPSNTITYSNHINAKPPRNFTAVVDPVNKAVTLTWIEPVNKGDLKLSPLVYYQIDKVDRQGGQAIGLRKNGLGYDSLKIPYEQNTATFYMNADEIADILYYPKTTFRIFEWTESYNFTNQPQPSVQGYRAEVEVQNFTSPGKVQNLTATPGDKQITLNWTPPPTSNGLIYQGAVITVRDPVSNFSVEINAYSDSADVKTRTITNLTNGVAYEVSVLANGHSPKGRIFDSSPVILENLIPAAVPTAPTGFSAIAGDSVVTMSWDDVTGDYSNGAIVTGYAYTISGVFSTVLPGGSTLVSSTENGKKIFTITSTGIVNGSASLFGVQAISSAGFGEISSMTVTATGNPIISNVVINGNTISCLVNPNGTPLAGFDCVAFSAFPKVTDNIFQTSTPADIASKPSFTYGSITLSFTYSFNVGAVIIIVQTVSGATIYNSFKL